jgi:ATP-dependent Clp protease ATP-binding subunit ClpX
MGRRVMGFGRDKEGEGKGNELLKHVHPEDLERFGLIPEFIGRLPVLATLDPLSAEDLVHVLTEPRNSLIRQYQKLFKFEKVKLNFSPDALRAVAEKAVVRKAGARGLRTILETMMLDIMYELPSQDNIKEVLITEEVIRTGAAPRIEPVRDYGVPG